MEHINIIGTIYDNSMSHTVAHASLVYDDNLLEKQDIINSRLRRDIDTALNNYNNIQPVDLTEIQEDINSLKNIINNLNISEDDEDCMYIVFLTQEQYDDLEEYDDDTLYFILEKSSWVLGDKLPARLLEQSSLGKFPITLT